MTDYCYNYICDYPEVYDTQNNLEHISTVFVEPLPKKFIDNVLDVSLGILGSVAILQFGLIFYTIYKSFKSGVKSITKLDVPKDKKIKIIRGVPGSGKRNYVYYLENGLNREFIICDWNDFFTKKGKYTFVGKDTTKAENHCLKVFLNSIRQDVKRIYVIGNFNEKWQYENYTTIGKLAGYDVSITELVCENHDELKYYNSRSTHNIPLSKSIKLFENWEEDKLAYKRRPYMTDEKALEFACLIQTNSDDESKELEYSESDNEDNDSDSLLPNIDTFDNPQSREITFVSKAELKELLDSYESEENSEVVSPDEDSEESSGSDSDYVQPENTDSEEESDSDTMMNNQNTILL